MQWDASDGVFAIMICSTNRGWIFSKIWNDLRNDGHLSNGKSYDKKKSTVFAFVFACFYMFLLAINKHWKPAVFWSGLVLWSPDRYTVLGLRLMGCQLSSAGQHYNG